MHADSIPVSNSRFSTAALDTTPQVVFPAVTGALGGTTVLEINAGGATGVVIFRAAGGGAEYFRANSNAGAARANSVPMVFPTSLGLEVLTTGAVGAALSLFYFTPGKAGLGA
jgi:hypothetical protein